MLKKSLSTATVALIACSVIVPVGGCQSSGRPSASLSNSPQVRNVICIYDRKPWISADAEGDRDPEGLRYRVFLDYGKNRGAFSDGTFHVEMYSIGRDENGNKKRELISDWHYPTSTFSQIRARILGDGYLLTLRWASKDTAGRDVEVVTSFEAPDGRKSRASTKRLRVPKYDDYLGRAN
jgi:hypothetical protein